MNEMKEIEDLLEVRPFYVNYSFLNTDEIQTMDILESENLNEIG